jgi:hypothetical protein
VTDANADLLKVAGTSVAIAVRQPGWAFLLEVALCCLFGVFAA